MISWEEIEVWTTWLTNKYRWMAWDWYVSEGKLGVYVYIRNQPNTGVYSGIWKTTDEYKSSINFYVEEFANEYGGRS